MILYLRNLLHVVLCSHAYRHRPETKGCASQTSKRAHLMPWRVNLLKRPSTIPCTAPSSIHRSPYMSLLYSLSSVVPKAKGAPTPMAQPTATSAALPVASCSQLPPDRQDWCNMMLFAAAALAMSCGRLPMTLMVETLFGSVCGGRQTLPLTRLCIQDHNFDCQQILQFHAQLVLTAMCRRKAIALLGPHLLVTYRAHMLPETSSNASNPCSQDTC